MSIINMTCGEINSSVGFVLVILSVILNQTLIDSDCEQSWYTELTMETMFREKYHDSVCNKNEPEDLDQTIDVHDHQQLPIEFGGNFHVNYKREANVEIQVLLQKTEGLTMENEEKFIKRSSSMDMLINFSDEGPDEIDEIPEMKKQIGLGNTHNTCSEARSIYFEQNRSEIKPWPVIFVIKLKIVI